MSITIVSKSTVLHTCLCCVTYMLCIFIFSKWLVCYHLCYRFGEARVYKQARICFQYWAENGILPIPAHVAVCLSIFPAIVAIIPTPSDQSKQIIIIDNDRSVLICRYRSIMSILYTSWNKYWYIDTCLAEKMRDEMYQHRNIFEDALQISKWLFFCLNKRTKAFFIFLRKTVGPWVNFRETLFESFVIHHTIKKKNSYKFKIEFPILVRKEKFSGGNRLFAGSYMYIMGTVSSRNEYRTIPTCEQI